MRRGEKLLLDEHPLVVLPSLAKAIGLNDAIILQQLHYWLRKSSHIHNERTWIFNTIDQWHGQFQFFSPNTIRRTLARLEKAGFVLVGNFNKRKYDKTKWYTIDYDRLPNLGSGLESEHQNCVNGTTQSGQMDVTNLGKPIPENTRDDAETNGQTRNPQRTNKRQTDNLFEVAEAIYVEYATRIRPGARSDAIKSISKLLKKRFTEAQLRESIHAYEADDLPNDKKFRIQANNFFGKAERFKDYLSDSLNDARSSEDPETDEVKGPTLAQKLHMEGKL